MGSRSARSRGITALSCFDDQVNHLWSSSPLMWFDSLAAVRAFAGDDYEVAVVPPAARALLNRFDARSAHYEVRQPRGAD